MQLYNLRMHDNSFFIDHLNDFNTLTSKLALVGVKIEEEDTIKNLLCSLPKTWDQLDMALSNSNMVGNWSLKMWW